MTATTKPGSQCSATTKKGEQCKAYALADSDFCFTHDPAHAGERAQARSKGGRARHGRLIGSTGDAEPVRVQSMADVVDLLERTVNDALKMENSLQRARTIATLAGTIVKALQFATLEERVAALEFEIRGTN